MLVWAGKITNNFCATLQTKKLAMLMDDISKIKPYKDSSLAMLLEAQSRGIELFIFDSFDMFAIKNQVFTKVQQIKVFKNNDKWFEVLEQKTIELKNVDFVFMRKDPPFDMNYIYATYLLELVEKTGVKVVNKPSSLRDFNEKVAITLFPNLTTDTLIASDKSVIKEFASQFDTTIFKPLDGMGGQDIFKHDKGENTNKTIDFLTNNEATPIMVQKFIPEIKDGDKRIILVGGKPIDYCIARIPAKGNFKGNLAAGATAKCQKLSENDYYLCEQIAPTLQKLGLDFVGLDVIGDYVSEINITSPTGIVELDRDFNTNIAGKLFDFLDV
jgi:glutathione synthase